MLAIVSDKFHKTPENLKASSTATWHVAVENTSMQFLLIFAANAF